MSFLKLRILVFVAIIFIPTVYAYEHKLYFVDVGQVELESGNLPFTVSCVSGPNSADALSISVDAIEKKGSNFFGVELRLCKAAIADRRGKELFSDEKGLDRKEVRNEPHTVFHITRVEVSKVFLVISFVREAGVDVYCVRLPNQAPLPTALSVTPRADARVAPAMAAAEL